MTPTRRQVEAWQAATELGNATDAAASLGLCTATFYSHLRKYAERTGEPYPPGIMRRGASGASERVDALNAKLDEALATVQRDTARLLGRVEHLVGLVERLEAAPRFIEVPAPTHRRKADGGVGGRRERRLTRRMIG